MSDQVIDLGEIDVFIMGRSSALIDIPQSMAEDIVRDLTRRLGKILEKRFGGTFSFEVVSIDDGCIKAKLRIFWCIAGTLAAMIAGYPNLKAGAKQLWNDAVPIITFVSEEKTYDAGFSGEKLLGGVYGQVKKNETLGEIVNKVGHGTYTRAQAMVAIYLYNKSAFADNVNLLMEGAVLLIPCREDIGKVTPEEAARILDRHNKELYTR